MFEKLVFDENNEKLLCERGGKNASMGMTIKVKLLLAGETLSVCSDTDETAALLLSGEVTFAWDKELRSAARRSPFDQTPYCLHVCRGTLVTISAVRDSELVIQQTDNDRGFAPVFYTPDDCLYQEFGKGQWGGAGHRVVATMFDYSNAPYSNMVMGEVFTKPGKWSSYPPHHHPQPEVYYYRFDKPQGFGACFNGDDVYKSEDGGYCCIEPGKAHQQATAPGYEMYYVWMIRHIDGDPWDKTRIYVKEHEWLDKAP